jgi:hypothetical protein
MDGGGIERPLGDGALRDGPDTGGTGGVGGKLCFGCGAWLGGGAGAKLALGGAAGGAKLALGGGGGVARRLDGGGGTTLGFDTGAARDAKLGGGIGAPIEPGRLMLGGGGGALDPPPRTTTPESDASGASFFLARESKISRPVPFFSPLMMRARA